MIIPLSRGYYALIDEIDKDLADILWNASTGKVIYAKRHPHDGTREGHEKAVLLHRVVMERKLQRPLQKGERIEFENRKPLDCRRSNLVLGTSSSVGARRKKDHRNTTGYKGVSFKKSKGKYEAWIGVNYQGIYLGAYTYPEDAARAYDKAARQYHGKRAVINFPEEHEDA